MSLGQAGHKLQNYSTNLVTTVVVTREPSSTYQHVKGPITVVCCIWYVKPKYFIYFSSIFVFSENG